MQTLNWTELGFPAPSKDIRVVVAMSGGVDSSVTASLLAEAGYDVVGICHLGGSHGTLETVSSLTGYGAVHQYMAQPDGSLKLKLHHFQDYSYVDINPQTPPEILALLKG